VGGLFRFKRLLRNLDVVAVVVFDDRIPFPEATLLRAAHALAVPTMLIPYAVSSPDADAFVRRGDKAYLLSAPVRHWIKRWIMKLLPGHVRNTKFGRMSFYRPWDTMVLAAFGIAGHRPWVWGAGPVSKVAAFGQKHRSDMIALGVAPDKIDEVGQVALDDLFRSQARGARIRDALLKQAGLSDDRPIFICALPQHAEHGMSSWADHFPATRALLQSLGSSGAHVFVSLHPRSKPSMYRGIISECGCHLLHQTFIDAIPAADCVFATFSSVLRWALLVGVPCVVVDQIGHNLPIYDGAEGVVIVKDGEEVSKIARRMVTDELWRNRLGSCAAVCARSNERFDGNAGARLVATLAGLVRDMEQVR
jgi:hypothetical protein